MDKRDYIVKVCVSVAGCTNRIEAIETFAADVAHELKNPLTSLRSAVETLPLAHDARSSLRTLNRTLENLNDRPQSILFGNPGTAPGPGEAGFVAPTK